MLPAKLLRLILTRWERCRWDDLWDISQARREGGASTGSGTVSRSPALAGKPQSASQSGRDSGGTGRAAGPGKNEVAAPAGTFQVPDAVADILDALRKKFPVKLSEAKMVHHTGHTTQPIEYDRHYGGKHGSPPGYNGPAGPAARHGCNGQRNGARYFLVCQTQWRRPGPDPRRRPEPG